VAFLFCFLTSQCECTAPPVPSDLETGRSFPSLLDEYDPSPVKYSTSRGKSGTYREATLSLFTERRNVNREKQRGITETLGSLKPGKLRSREASPGPSKSEIIHGNVKAYKELNSDEPVAEDDLSEATTRLDPASDLCDEKKIEDSNGNTIGISLRTEENSGPRQEPHTAPNDNVSSPESTINFKSSINLSHLRALVKPSESNLASSESLLSYRLNSSSSRKENFHNPSEIGVLGEPANLLPSVQGYIPSQPTGDSSIYSSERTSTPISAGMGECPMDTSCLAFPSRTPERKAPDQAQNSYQASGNGLRKKISPVPIFYPPAGRTRPLDVGTIRSIYPDRFPHSLQKLRRVTDHEIFEKKLDSNDKAGESSKDIQAQSRRSSYGAVTTNVGGSSSRPSDAWHPENCIKSGVGALRTTSCGLNPEYFPGIEGPQAASSSKDNGEGISAIPTNQLTATGRLKSSISLGDRLRGHGRYNKDVEARRRASTNNLKNHATPDTENIDENSDMKNKFSGHRLKMVRSLSRLKNKMYPLSGLKYEMNTKSPASTTVYHLSSYKPGGDFEDKDKGSPTLESDLGNEMEEGMKCSKGAGDIPDGILVKETDNGPIELASDGSDSGVPIIEANPESAFTGYEDCVLLPFSLASFETLAEVRSQENLMELSSPERISGRLE